MSKYHCININTPEIQALAKELSMHPAIVAAKVSVWQVNNKSMDFYPTADALRPKAPQNKFTKGKLGKGEEISSYSTGLAFALTNPTVTSPKGFTWNRTWDDSQKQWRDYMSNGISFEGTTYKDVEEAYQKNKNKYPIGVQRDDFMRSLLETKLETYPKLISEIDKKGGEDYLRDSTHQPTSSNSHWETNGSNAFIRLLTEAYNNVKSSPTPDLTTVQSTGTIPYDYVLTLPTGKKITLNNQQVNGLNAMFEWEKNMDIEFTLAGFAGTGKTTVTKVFIDRFKGAVAVSAPTHKAKKVIARTSGKKAETIHSLLGLKPNVDLETFDINNPQFDSKSLPRIGDYAMVVVDEASMINKSLYKLLMQKAEEFGTKILFMGDNAQLPPVKEEESLVFSSAKNIHWLTKVERTAGGNPLLDIFTTIRENITSLVDKFSHQTNQLEDGKGVKFFKGSAGFTKEVLATFTSEEYKKNPFTFAKVLTYTNEAALNWNKTIRDAIIGVDKGILAEGDLIMAYANIKGNIPGRIEFENSADYIVKSSVSGEAEGMKVIETFLENEDGDVTRRVFLDHTDKQSVEIFKKKHDALLNAAINSRGYERGMTWATYFRFRDSYVTMVPIGTIKKYADYGNAITTHKSQGSTYEKVFIDENNLDSNMKSKERNQLKYVAFTRASDTVYSLSAKTGEEVVPLPELPDEFSLLPTVRQFKTGINYGVVAETVGNQIKRLYEQLSVLSKKEATTTDKVELKNIRVQIFNINKLIEKKTLQKQEANAAVRLEDLVKVMKEQIAEAKDILNNSSTVSAEQLAYFTKSLNLVIEAGDFTKNDHILFDEIELLSVHLKDMFGDMAKQAAELLREVDTISEDLISKLVSETTGKVMTKAEFARAIEDASGLKVNTLNLSRMNDTMLSSIFIRMKEAQFAAHTSAQEIFDKTDNLLDRIMPILTSMNFKDPFSLFKQRTENGNLTGDLVFRYSDKYFKDRQAIWSDAYNDDGTVHPLNYAKAMNWSRKNELVFDARKLFPTSTTDSYQWTTTTYTQQQVDDHIQELKNNLGETGFNELYNRLDKKMEKFQMMHEVVKDEINGNNAIAPADKLLQLEYWEKTNSPYWLSESRETGRLVRIGNQIVSATAGMKYTHVVPRKTINNTDTGWYDEQFSQIESNPDLKEFYDYFLDTLKALNQMIPSYKREGYQINTLPTVKKAILEVFRDNPRLLTAELFGKFVESTRVNDEAIIDYNEIDPLTGKTEQKIQLHVPDTRKKIADLVKLKRIAWEQMNVGKVATIKDIQSWREEAKNEIAQEKSYDLGKVLRAYSMQILAYHHKAVTENLLNIAVNVFNERKEVVTTNAGEIKGNVDSFERTQDGLANLKSALDYQMKAYSGLPIHKVQRKTDKRVYTPKEKKKRREIEALMEENETLFANGDIDIKKYESTKSILIKQYEALGGDVAGSKLGDIALKWNQLLGMGWNLTGAFANRGFGIIANWTEAADGRLYGFREMRRAYAITFNSVGKNLTFDRWGGVNNTAMKIRSLMDKFNVLQESKNELYKSSNASRFLRKFQWLNPYQLNARTEYLNQSEPFIARLLRLKVSDMDSSYTGTESLWDSYDEHGNWTITGVPEPSITRLQVEIESLVNRLHGDYSNPQKSKEKWLGRALFQFRTWMAEMVNNVYGSQWEDETGINGTVVRKGRLKSMTLTQHILTASAFTGVAFGLPGFAIGGAIGVATGAFFGMKSPMNVMTELLFTAKVIFRQAQLSDGFKDETDMANMRANMMQISVLLALAGTALMIKAASDTEDDEAAKYAANFLLNQLSRMQTDITFYTNPLEFEKLAKSALPVFALITGVAEWWEAFADCMEGEDAYKTGNRKGESKLWRKTMKITPGLRQYPKIQSIGEQVYGQ